MILLLVLKEGMAGIFEIFEAAGMLGRLEGMDDSS